MKNTHIFIIFALFAFVGLTLTGSFSSGFHLIDDHEMIRIEESYHKGESLSKVVAEWQLNDLRQRFRPLYFIHRASQPYFFGLNWAALYIYQALLGIITAYFLFLFALNSGFTKKNAVLFSVLTIIGEQSAVWWRLGPSESLAMFFLSIALYFMAKANNNPKKYSYEILFLFFTIAATLSKESVVMMLPALMFWRVWQSSDKENQPFFKSIFKVLPSLVILGILFVVEIYLIKKVVGTSKIVYAGVDESSFQILNFVKSAISLWGYHGGYLVPALLLFVFVLIQNPKHFVQNWWQIIILFGLISLPQIFLYAKSGLGERYLLPGVLGSAYLITYQINKNITLAAWQRNTYLAVLLLFFVFHTAKGINFNLGYARDGREANALLSDIISHTSPESEIVVVGNALGNFEGVSAIRVYLTSYNGNRKNSYIYKLKNIKPSTPSDFGLIKYIDNVSQGLTVDKPENLKNLKAVVMVNYDEKTFLNEAKTWFNPKEFVRHENSQYVYYLRVVSH